MLKHGRCLTRWIYAFWINGRVGAMLFVLYAMFYFYEAGLFCPGFCGYFLLRDKAAQKGRR